MAEHGGGSIINIISVSGLKPSALQGFYASTKAALHAMTKVMAAEWAPLGIRVNDLAPVQAVVATRNLVAGTTRARVHRPGGGRLGGHPAHPGPRR